MTVFTDNPAGRLHDLLSAFYRSGGTRDQFALALKLPRNDDAGLMRAFASVFALPDDIKNEISQVNEDNYEPDLALRWQGNLADVMGSTLFWGEKDPDSPIFTEFLSSLEYCSYVLHRNRPEAKLSKTDREKLKKLISELLAELADNVSLDAGSRAFLVSHAEAIDNALAELDIRGIVTLEETFDRAIGALNRRADLTVRHDKSPAVWKKFTEVLVAVAAVLQISTSTFMLPGQVRQAIEGPQPTLVEVVQQKPSAPTAPVASDRPNPANSKFARSSATDTETPAS